MPVVLLALLTLAIVIFELGAFIVELIARRKRRMAVISVASDLAREAIDKGDRLAADDALEPLGWSPAMRRTLGAFVQSAGKPGADTRLSKELADFDFGRQSRLARTRLLVRFGPALGLMGTLIPLSPALDGLARGDVTTLTKNLRVAFSITVLGLLVGAVAFALSLIRDRMYGQDLSDLEYVAAILTEDRDEHATKPRVDAHTAEKVTADDPVTVRPPRA